MCRPPWWGLSRNEKFTFLLNENNEGSCAQQSASCNVYIYRLLVAFSIQSSHYPCFVQRSQVYEQQEYRSPPPSWPLCRTTTAWHPSISCLIGSEPKKRTSSQSLQKVQFSRVPASMKGRDYEMNAAFSSSSRISIKRIFAFSCRILCFATCKLLFSPCFL